MRNLAISVAVLAAVALLAGCGSDGGEQSARAAAAPSSEATLVGTITSVEAFTPITEDCVPADSVDPDSVVSSDDPPVCTNPAHAPQGSILVEAEPRSRLGDKIVFSIGPQTVLLSRTGGDEPDTPSGMSEISFADLHVGDTARVGYSGPVAASYPGQATADSVVASGPAS